MLNIFGTQHRNTGAIDVLAEDYTDDPIMNPSQEVIDKSEVFSDLDANTFKII